MTTYPGLLAALVEDAARDAGCTVAQMLGPFQSPSERVASRRAAFLAAAANGYSREQTARAFKVTKRTVVRGVRIARKGVHTSEEFRP